MGIGRKVVVGLKCLLAALATAQPDFATRVTQRTMVARKSQQQNQLYSNALSAQIQLQVT
jgi:hypothetical protein